LIKQLALREFTVFSEATFDFMPGVNVVVGENALGKSHVLKLGYTCASISHSLATAAAAPTAAPGDSKADLQKRLAEKLRAVFRPDSLGRLARRGAGRRRAEVAATFYDLAKAKLEFSFATNSKSEVVLDKMPSAGVAAPALFFPTKEVISMFPRFASLYRDYHIEIDETYYDLCLALERPLLRGRRYDEVKALLKPLEKALGGTVSNDAGRFVLSIPGQGNMEIPLVAEGMRKLATVAYLVANGTLMNKATLYWDEPETNLNPRLLSQLAEILVLIAAQGTQLVLATHSLFLLKELDLRLAQAHKEVTRRFFALAKGEEGGTTVHAGDSVEQIEPIAALDAEIDLSDRYEAVMQDGSRAGVPA
jgi:predicted ATPase